MAKPHDARKQKKLAKHKAKRSAKRATLQRRDSKDPTIRLQGAANWPVVRALVGADFETPGISNVLIVRQEGQGRFVYAVYLVDMQCLGVKDAFWRASTQSEIDELVRRLEEVQHMKPVSPACLAKLVLGAVQFAESFGFPPPPDFHHASMLLAGIDASACPTQFTYGKDGKPLYIAGPHDSPTMITAITRRLQEAGGDFIIPMTDGGMVDRLDIDDDPDELEFLDDDGFLDDIEER
jgi:hypothetical protein